MPYKNLFEFEIDSKLLKNIVNGLAENPYAGGIATLKIEKDGIKTMSVEESLSFLGTIHMTEKCFDKIQIKEECEVSFDLRMLSKILSTTTEKVIIACDENTMTITEDSETPKKFTMRLMEKQEIQDYEKNMKLILQALKTLKTEAMNVSLIQMKDACNDIKKLDKNDIKIGIETIKNGIKISSGKDSFVNYEKTITATINGEKARGEYNIDQIRNALSFSLCEGITLKMESNKPLVLIFQDDKVKSIFAMSPYVSEEEISEEDENETDNSSKAIPEENPPDNSPEG
jgi:hypothetical protein